MTAVINLRSWLHQHGFGVLGALSNMQNPDMVADCMLMLIRFGFNEDEIIKKVAAGQMLFYFKEPLTKITELQLPLPMARTCVALLSKYPKRPEIMSKCIEILAQTDFFSSNLLRCLEGYSRSLNSLKTIIEFLHARGFLKAETTQFLLTCTYPELFSLLELLDKADCLDLAMLAHMQTYEGCWRKFHSELNDYSAKMPLTKDFVLQTLRRIERTMSQKLTLLTINSIFCPQPVRLVHAGEPLGLEMRQ